LKSVFTNLARSVGHLYLLSLSSKDQDFQVSKAPSLKKTWPQRTIHTHQQNVDS